ncbi:PAS domain S-box protein [Pedobacter sp. MR2016-24]|uniref:PAS domain-containing protein n=1 Tax=Pedobacter sp. MR2016-24 TaxID=2994466 RepID=UPI002246AB65|nr:PAS domain S-box protein [Pedobacter sp. MR2016-24]MCX2485392.1 PAS domain S-box protein [Pedobacter sp. MR2016-24]
MILSHDLFQLSPVPMWVFDAETLKFKVVNTAAVNIYGYTAEEFLSMTIHTILHDEDEYEARHIKKSGEIIYVNFESTIIDFEGRVAKLITICSIIDKEGREKEIAERSYNEEQGKLNEERFNIISKATSDTIWDWNLITDIIEWNKGIKGIFGYKNLEKNRTSGDWWIDHIHPEDREKVVHNIRRHINDRIERWVEEYRFLCADGSYKYVYDRGFMVFNENGSSIRMIGSMQDISQRKQEEQWSRLLESVVINATDAVQICTGNTEGSGQSIIYVNEAFTKMSGYTKHELIGASPRISQGPETDINEIRKLKSAIENKVPCEIEVINYTKQGKEYWVSQSSAPIADSNGLVTHWISIQRDITQNRNYLKEIEEQNKKFKEIAWIQSHLVRAPLARVMGLVDLLKNFVPGDDGDELLLHLENSAKELDAIIINIADKTPSNKG